MGIIFCVFHLLTLFFKCSVFSKWTEKFLFSCQAVAQFLSVTVLPFDSLNNNTAECEAHSCAYLNGRHIYIHCFPQVTTIHSLPNDKHNLKIIKFIQQKNLSIKNIFEIQKQPLWLDSLIFSSCMFHCKKILKYLLCL